MGCGGWASFRLVTPWVEKAHGVRMAQSGATENEIAAKLGHSDTRSASVYTKGADLQRLADAAIRKVQEQSAPLK